MKVGTDKEFMDYVRTAMQEIDQLCYHQRKTDTNIAVNNLHEFIEENSNHHQEVIQRVLNDANYTQYVSIGGFSVSINAENYTVTYSFGKVDLDIVHCPREVSIH